MEGAQDRRNQDRFLGTPLAQIAGLSLALVLGITFMLSGLYSVFCLPMLIGVALYVVPKVMGAKDIRVLLAAGAVYLVAISMVGAFAVTPAYIDAHDDGGSLNESGFSGAGITDANGDGLYDITVTYTGTGDVEFCYGDVVVLYYGSAGIEKTPQRVLMTAAGTTYTVSDVDLRDGKLEYYFFESKDAGGATVAKTSSFFYTGTISGGALTSLSLEGNLYFVGINIMFVYFLVVIFTFFSRRSLEKVRDKMEKEGRLYPQGYGRCKECGSLVLPGETCCRKCGAFIEKPEAPAVPAPENDAFECSECGESVPADADSCPKCGAKFDDDEDKTQSG